MYFLLTLSVIAISFLIIYVLQYYKYIKRFHECLEKYCGPPRHPLLGNALDFGKSTEILQQTLDFRKKYGSIYKVSMGLSNFSLVVADTKFLEFLLSSQKLLEKSSDYRYLHKWLATGLLTSDGKKWKLRRKIITPTFHFQILEQFIEVFHSANEILIKKMKTEVGKDSTNIYPLITMCALDIICESAMGVSVNAQNHTESDYVNSVKEVCRILIERAFSIVKMYDFLYLFTKDYYKEKHAVKILHDYTDAVIKKRRKELQDEKLKHTSDETYGVKKRLAFLDLLLQSTVDGKPLTHEDIREEVDTFMFEGHDTTASAMSFAIYCLSNHHDVQEKCVAELKEIFADDKNRTTTYKDLQAMKYLEMVIKESLRLYPSVPMYGRQLKEDVEYDGTILPKGLTLSVFAYGIHRDPEIYPNPEVFDPDRFRIENCIGRSPYAYIPFSAGPRNCIGQKFAMLEMKSLISQVLRNFKIQPAIPNHKLILAAETVLKASNGIFIRLEKRNF